MKNKSQGNTEKNKVRNKIKDKLDIVSFEEYISGSRYKFFGKRLKICGVVGLIALIAQVICIALLINELKTNFLNNSSYLFWLGFAIVSFIIISFSFLEKPLAISGASKVKPISCLIHCVSFLLYSEYILVIVVPASLFLLLAYGFQRITNFINLKYIVKHIGLFGFHFWIFLFTLFLYNEIKNNTLVKSGDNYNHDMIIYSLLIYLFTAFIIIVTIRLYFRFYYTEKIFQANDSYYEWYRYNENIMRIYEFLLLFLIVIEYIKDPNGYLIVVLMIVQILPDLKNRMDELSSRHRENEYMYDYLRKLEYIQNSKILSVKDIFDNEYFSSKDTELYMLDCSLCFVDYIALHNIKDSDCSNCSEFVAKNMNSLSRSILSSKTFRVPLVHRMVFKSPYVPIKLSGVIVKRVQFFGIELYVYVLESADKREYIYNLSSTFNIKIITDLIDDLSEEKNISNYNYILDDCLYKYSYHDPENPEVICTIKSTTELNNKLNKKFHNIISKIKGYSFRSDAEEIEETRDIFLKLYCNIYKSSVYTVDDKNTDYRPEISCFDFPNPSIIFDNIYKIIKGKEFKSGKCTTEEYTSYYLEINNQLSSLRSMLDNMIKLINNKLSDEERDSNARLDFLIKEHNYDSYKKIIYDELFNRAFTPEYIMKSKSLIFDLPADIKMDESGEARN